jgi:hypothetical protein
MVSPFLAQLNFEVIIHGQLEEHLYKQILIRNCSVAHTNLIYL